MLSCCFCTTATKSAHRSGQPSFTSVQRLLLPSEISLHVLFLTSPSACDVNEQGMNFSHISSVTRYGPSFLQRRGYIVMQDRWVNSSTFWVLEKEKGETDTDVVRQYL